MKSFVLPTIFTVVDNFTAPASSISKKLNSISDSAFKVARNTALMGAAIVAPMVLAAKSAISFEDRMADVAKTTQLTGSELSGLGSDILDLATKTRTPIEGLQKISEIGGQLGITGRKNILSFTDSVNKFSVALGSDFQGGVEEAARAIGSLNILFKETRKLDIADSITRAGSAMNALSAKGVQVPELTEFTKRIGQLPDAIKPTIQETIALGAVFNKAGISAEIAARGLGDVLLTASQNAPGFAKQIGISTKATRELLNTNPTEFLKKFAASLQGMDAGQFATISKDLKLADVGSIKVIGSLASGIDKLTEFQSISNNEFAKSTSLLSEYNVKNETTAAKLAMVKNNFEALSITIGTELIPIVIDLLKTVTPIIKKATDWVRENKELTKTFVKIAIGVAAMYVVSACAVGVALYSKALILNNTIQLLWGTAQAVNLALQGKTLLFLEGNALAMGIYKTIMLVVTAAQWAWNAAMTANPIGLLIVGIVAMIAIIALVIYKWDEWGAAVTTLFAFFMPGIALIISLVITFYKNWHMITQAFKGGGILNGLLAIGKVLLDVILNPLQQILELIAKVTGADWAASAASGLKEFRTDLGLNTGDVSQTVEAVNPERERQQAVSDRFEEISRQQLDVNINDPSGRATSRMGSGPIPIKLSSTHKFGS
jgi:TP901 family phage tail tape measure protein